MKTKVILGLIILLTISLIYFGLIHEKAINFDRSKWLTDIESRFEMGDDIIDSKLLIGKDTNQVKQILGELDNRKKGSIEWFYFMGSSQSGFGVSIHHLAIRFDSNKKVIVVDHIKTKT